jgi:hypothetical protein
MQQQGLLGGMGVQQPAGAGSGDFWSSLIPMGLNWALNSGNPGGGGGGGGNPGNYWNPFNMYGR